MFDRAAVVAGAIVICSMAILGGCAHHEMAHVPSSAMDSPEHHCSTGDGLLDKGLFQKALEAYRQAEMIDRRHAPAQIGIGLSLAGMQRFDDALDAFRKARSLATSDRQRMLYHTGMMRLHTARQNKDWLDKTESHFNQARSIKKDDPAPYYYMAAAYSIAREYAKASHCYEKVIDLNRGYVEQSNTSWAELQKTVRAIPGTRVGKDIAGSPAITRAEVAALFMEELRIDRLFQGGARSSLREGDLVMTDFQNHPLRRDVEAVIALEVRGLEPIGNRFFPDRAISRAEFAVMLEDILVKITREKGVSTRHLGAPSPFSDVEGSYYAYNAILTCTTRGILDPGVDGRFRPGSSVSGTDALLALRQIKGVLEKSTGWTLQ